MDVDPAIVEAFAGIQGIARTVLEATTGHRAEIERQGFAPEMAEMMAAGFYAQLMTFVFQQLNRPPASTT